MASKWRKREFELIVNFALRDKQNGNTFYHVLGRAGKLLYRWYVKYLQTNREGNQVYVYLNYEKALMSWQLSKWHHWASVQRELKMPTVDFGVEINKVEANTHFRVWPSLSLLQSISVSIKTFSLCNYYVYLTCTFLFPLA